MEAFLTKAPEISCVHKFLAICESEADAITFFARFRLAGAFPLACEAGKPA